MLLYATDPDSFVLKEDPDDDTRRGERTRSPVDRHLSENPRTDNLPD